MALAVDKIKERIQGIESLADSSSERYGRLLNWHNPPDLFWHYGIGLSDMHIFDTGCGLCPFERKEAKLVLGVEPIAFSPQQTIERLKQVPCVFADWKYTFPGWNCEHLGRLIATDAPRCYQSSPWWMCDLTPQGEYKRAHQVFWEHLKQTNLSLNR